MAASCHLGFGPTGSISVQSVPENPTLESNTKLIGQPVPESDVLSYHANLTLPIECWQ